MIFRIFKRGFDFVSALILFILFSPFFLILIILVRIKLGSPIFFVQERTGKNLKNFNLIKFRTMTNETDANGNLLPDEMRQTRFGGFLRSTSLDEIPELFCIIKGEMSVIGPRPLPPIYNDYYTDRELKRFNVRGGLIPPDSIDDSAIISWNEQFEYEVNYAENISFKNDIKIFLNVFKIIFQRRKTNYGDFVRKPLYEERKKAKRGDKN
jgi:lipopolysaccharide/colanic/teichoic acid biosynthesis glycosyltransferase